jgi:hypothetical protein
VTGNPGNRELVVEWRNVRHFSCNADSAVTVRFQVVFFEGSSDILFNYADVYFGGACTAFDRGGSATVGVQTASNQATTFSLNSQSLADGTTLLWTVAEPPPPATPSLSVTPPSLNFGSIPVGTTADMSFTVTNSGEGTLTGSASTSATGFSIVGGGSFSLGAGAGQSVTVRFNPPSAAVWSGNVAFTSNGGDASPSVTGTGVNPGSITVNSPNGGETWLNNSLRNITWASSDVVGNVKIDISRNGEATWTTIISSTANDGSETWKVKRPQTTQARIRVCSINAPIVCDTSDANFTIR